MLAGQRRTQRRWATPASGIAAWGGRGSILSCPHHDKTEARQEAGALPGTGGGVVAGALLATKMAVAAKALAIEMGVEAKAL
ncbi:hypothetical protein Tco_1426655, partial [Tanacetum coccineum]